MILLTGATGTIGRLLSTLLADAGAEVRAVSRNPQPAAFPAGVEVVHGDPSLPESVDPFLDGVTTLFVNPRAVGVAAADLLATAEKRGLTKVVGLAAINVDDDPTRQPSRYRGDLNKEVEDAVTGCGLDWVSLRPTVFAGNTLGLWGGQIRAGDVVRGPYAAATAAPIHESDIAAVAARALLTDELLGRRIPLTGPESLTQLDMVAAIGGAIGRSLRYEEVHAEAARQRMVDRGFPAAFADAYLSMQAAAVRQPATTTDGVEAILGRPARTFDQWAAEHADAFRG